MERFRLGAVTDDFSQDIAIAAPAMRELGMTGAELRMLGGRNIIDVSNEELDRAIDILGNNDLTVVTIASPLLKCRLPDAPDLDVRFEREMFASSHTWADQNALTDRAFEIALRTGAKIVRVFSFWRVVQPREVFERVVDALQDLSDKANQHGLVIALENEQACNVATAQETACVLAAVDHSNLQVVWDPANSYISGERAFPSGYQVLEAGRIAHVHVKDCKLHKHIPSWHPLGEGDIDWEGQLRALAEDGYKGYLHLETYWPGPDGDKLEGSRICGERLRIMCEAVK